jgi:hypothetical protein
MEELKWGKKEDDGRSCLLCLPSFFVVCKCYLFTSSYCWLHVYDRKSQRLVEELIGKKIVVNERYQSQTTLGLVGIGMWVVHFFLLIVEWNYRLNVYITFNSYYLSGLATLVLRQCNFD